MPALLGQITGGIFAVVFLMVVFAFILGKITNIPRGRRLAYGVAVAPLIAAFIWSYGEGDGTLPYFVSGFVVYSASAFWVFVIIMLSGSMFRE